MTSLVRAPHGAGRRLVVASRVLAAVAVLAVGVTLTPSAAAAPKHDIGSVRKRVDSLGETVSKVTEQYDQARIALTSAQKKVAALNKRAAKQQAEADRLRRSIAAMAASAYMGGVSDLATLATATTPQDVVDKATSIDQLSDQDRSKIEQYQHAMRQVAAERRSAKAALSQQRQVTSSLKSKKATILKTLAKQKVLLNQLNAAGRNDNQASRADRTPIHLPSASGRAGAAISYARAQLGKPYSWGADGPDSYDCSGLTMASWRQAGVSLPHSSQQQYSSLPHVPRSALQPGDLVFFGSPIHHVGIYVGNNQMIDAPNSGEVVRYDSLNHMGTYAGAGRPG
ncbi:MAG: C40 family peptidase [Acidothermales bacterium]|nr:C40 family peptidase [Acidothermales bacterium]